MAYSLSHTNSEVKALVQKLINKDKGRQNALLELTFRFEDSCAVRDDLRKAYEKCNDISQESHALICTILKGSSNKDRKLHLSMYGKAVQLERQMGAKSDWFREKYSIRTRKRIEALKEMLEEEAMNKKAQEEKIRQEQAENNAFFLEFGVVRYDSEYESSD
ncbi:hypothetical protein Tco_0706309 [Tanacetum coccineum]|uniref:Flagellar FliJ protein n=1 Tax=Tanacetum coccineum TaxID=301880 RepID=A0ABQ4Y703_9ASTR